LLGRNHHLAVSVARPWRFAHPGAEFANFGTRRAEHDGPIDLVCVTITKSFAQKCGGAWVAGDDEAAGGVAVEAMHEFRLGFGVEL
jgi:hypothetical protein